MDNYLPIETGQVSRPDVRGARVLRRPGGAAVPGTPGGLGRGGRCAGPGAGRGGWGARGSVLRGGAGARRRPGDPKPGEGRGGGGGARPA